jgi:tRNA threonylcarbamoyl adenosine modification protein YeaZ
VKTLALELSTARGSLAWLDAGERPTRAPAAAREGACAPQNEALVREWPNDRKDSGAFFENLQSVTRKFALPEKIIVGLGPGSYAGVRIAIAAAIGLQSASGARLIGFPSICAIENTADDYAVIGDARRQSFYFARIRENEIIEGPKLFAEFELRDELDRLKPEISIFSSDHLPQFEHVELCYPSALILARLAQDENRNFSSPPLEPIYLREPHITIPKPAGRGIGILADGGFTG